MTAYFAAQHVKHHSGGAVIAPWDIEPGREMHEWVQAAVLLSQVPQMRNRRKETEAYLLKRRKAHPQYSKYRNQ